MIVNVVGCAACTPAVRGPDVDARINDRHVGVRFGDAPVPERAVLVDGEWLPHAIEAFDGGEGGWVIEAHIHDGATRPHLCCQCGNTSDFCRRVRPARVEVDVERALAWSRARVAL